MRLYDQKSSPSSGRASKPAVKVWNCHRTQVVLSPLNHTTRPELVLTHSRTFSSAKQTLRGQAIGRSKSNDKNTELSMSHRSITLERWTQHPQPTVCEMPLCCISLTILFAADIDFSVDLHMQAIASRSETLSHRCYTPNVFRLCISRAVQHE